MTKVSEKFIRIIKLHSYRRYEIALAAGLHPSTLSKILTGAEPIRRGDPRVIRIGKVIGLEPHEFFEEEDAT